LGSLHAIFEWIGLILASLALIGWLVTFGSTLAIFYLVILHWRHRRRGLADEAARLARPLPPEAELPHVVVQIPTYNEGQIVARAVAAAVALDWPRDRLTVQLLDDSTDESAEIARRVVDEHRARGCDVVLIHRKDRSDFKAGALANATALSPHGFFAIFDVDYVPAPCFLRQAMGCLLAEPELAFVQARFDYFNAGANDLTRTQALLLDAHLAIEQATRSWIGHPLPFNGTCGVWRRDAIELAGGWEGGTLAEDLDLSYRAWRRGRRGRFLLTVAVPGELPETLDVWTTQQRRWTKGFGQVALRMTGPVLRDRRLSLRDRLAALLHLGVWWSGPAWGVALPLGVAAIICHPALAGSLGAVMLCQFLVGYAALFVFLRSGNLSLRPGSASFGHFVRAFGLVSYHLFKIGAQIGRAQREVVLGRRSEFVRTPKTALARPAAPALPGQAPAEPLPRPTMPGRG
jgi:cellulose synthase/poly-beta-1,6-N-acetylglucosamine synthase-like glycosyltransferase